MKKYALYPGRVISQTDGDKHFIDGPTLASLYGVSMRECMIVTTRMQYELGQKHLLEKAEKLIPLRPRVDGRYSVPEKTKAP